MNQTFWKLLLLAFVLCLAAAAFAGCNEEKNKPAPQSENAQNETQNTDQNETKPDITQNTDQGNTPSEDAPDTPPENLLTVSFDSNGGNEIPAQQIEKGNKAAKPQDPTRAGYTFTGWTYQGETWSFIGYLVTEDMTLTANWQINTYSISYTLNGGTANNRTSYTVEQVFTLQEPTRTSYTFTGWTYEGQETPVLSVTISHETGNKAYTANWQANTYTLTLDANGGECEQETLTVTYDSAYTLPTPTRAGYTFLGWYNGNTEYTNGTWRGTAGLTLTANWRANTYQISYADTDASGVYAAGSTKTQQVTFGSAFELITPTRNGATFLGWYQGDAKRENGVYQTAGDIALTARWDFTVYNITYDVAGGEAVENPANYIVTDNKVLAEPTRVNYAFLGWYDINGNKITHLNGLYCDLQLTASWEYVFTHNGNVLTSITVAGRENCTKMIIPAEMDGVQITGIGARAFSSCTALTTIEIPASVTFIDEHAFSGCTSLTSIDIPESVKSIGSKAFYDCVSLKNVILGENSQLINIGDHAFSECISLVSIRIPASVTIIGKYAFYNCTALNNVCVENAQSIPSQSMTEAFSDNTIDVDTYGVAQNIIWEPGYIASATCPYTSPYTLSSSGSWNSAYRRTKIFTVPEAGTMLIWSESARKGAPSTYSLVVSLWDLEDGNYIANHEKYVEGIGKASNFNIRYNEDTQIITYIYVTQQDYERLRLGAYGGKGFNSFATSSDECPKITVISPGIGDYAFFGCSGLQSITISENIRNIGYNAFLECNSLVNVTFKETEKWHITEVKNATSIYIIVVTNISQNAINLTDTYSDYYWHRD